MVLGFVVSRLAWTHFQGKSKVISFDTHLSVSAYANYADNHWTKARFSRILDVMCSIMRCLIVRISQIHHYELIRLPCWPDRTVAYLVYCLRGSCWSWRRHPTITYASARRIKIELMKIRDQFAYRHYAVSCDRYHRSPSHPVSLLSSRRKHPGHPAYFNQQPKKSTAWLTWWWVPPGYLI